jgi:hypothetical protein
VLTLLAGRGEFPRASPPASRAGSTEAVELAGESALP